MRLVTALDHLVLTRQAGGALHAADVVVLFADHLRVVLIDSTGGADTTRRVHGFSAANRLLLSRRTRGALFADGVGASGAVHAGGLLPGGRATRGAWRACDVQLICASLLGPLSCCACVARSADCVGLDVAGCRLPRIWRVCTFGASVAHCVFGIRAIFGRPFAFPTGRALVTRRV